jgi:hypothetical protein
MKAFRKRLKGCFSMFVVQLSSGGTPLFIGFTNSYCVDDPNDRKSTAGYFFSLGSGPVTWVYKKQQDIVLYSIETEYREAINESEEALWLR